MIRMLLVYSIRHPANFYSQGMNDILAPIFAVFAAEVFEQCFLWIENNIPTVFAGLTEAKLQNAEADAYFCFK